MLDAKKLGGGGLSSPNDVPDTGGDPDGYRFEPGRTGLRIEMAKSRWQLVGRAKIQLNRGVVPRPAWGANYIPVPAGQYQVIACCTQWSFDSGTAYTDVSVIPDHTTVVHYRAPASAWVRGAIGPVPPRARGVAIAYIDGGIQVVIGAGLILYGLQMMF